MFIHIYIYNYTYIYVFMYIYTYIHVYIYIFMYIYIHVYIYTHTRLCLYPCQNLGFGRLQLSGLPCPWLRRSAYWLPGRSFWTPLVQDSFKWICPNMVYILYIYIYTYSVCYMEYFGIYGVYIYLYVVDDVWSIRYVVYSIRGLIWHPDQMATRLHVRESLLICY